ncbi:MAG: prepilin-type N-terminal cleavage/methylation domain-containing protein [Anaerolineales bacterium]|nr:prepilin-type N-terminal cleavage/methylation domain-containing protein [Anaerolineales bacterium]
MARHRTGGVTLIELLVVLAVIGLLAALLLPALRKGGSSRMLTCINNLKQISLGFTLFADDHDNQFPAQISTNQGGAKELLQPNGAVEQFVTLSNTLGTPKILACYADTNRHRAIRFEELTTSNVSYFINADAGTATTNQLLVGDDHLISDTATSSGFMTLQSNSKLRWTDGRHHESGTFKNTLKGHVAFVDGSARRIGDKELTDIVGQQVSVTNRLVKSAPPAK